MSSIVKFLFGVLLFAGLPLVGWGVTDIRGFIDHSARLAYIAVVVLLQGGIVIKWPTVGRCGGDGKQVVRRQRIATVLLQILSVVIIILAPYCDHWNIMAYDEIAFMRYFGLSLFALGFIGINWAEAVLGNQFSIQVTLQEGHQLVTKGPYRYVRHPRYANILLYNVGLALLYRSLLALILVGVLMVVLLWRIHDEEALMHEAFGEDWEAYSKETMRLIPWLY